MTPFRVWPSDLDVLMHMNNGKYFSIMDLARTDLMIRSGSLALLNKKGIYPVVASEAMKFKKSLELFKKFEVQTKVVGFDERNFYLEQSFVSKGQMLSLAFIKAQFLYKKGGKVTPSKIMELLHLEHIDLELPSYIEDWNKSVEEGFKAHLES